MTDPYRVLEVSPDATDEEIKKAYRKLCKRYHPDLHTGKSDEQEAEKRFLEVQRAYQDIMKARQGGGTEASGFNPYGGFWGSAYGPGYGGYDYGRQRQEDESSQIRAAKVYIDAGHYAEALNALSGVAMEERNARWYFLNALAQCGLHNTAQAMEYARQAVKMDPSNIQYRQLYSELEGRINSGESEGNFSRMANQILTYESLGIMQFDGRTEINDTVGEGIEHEEFYVSEKSILNNLRKVMNLKEAPEDYGE